MGDPSFGAGLPPDALLARLQVPAGAQSWSVETVRGALSVTALCPTEGEDWFLFVPGYLASKEDFYSVMVELAARRVGAVAFDLRGSQDSAPGNGQDDYSLAAQAADVCAVSAEVRSRWSLGPAQLVGHSLGGLIAQQAAGMCEWSSVTFLCSGPGALPAHRAGVLPLIRRFVSRVDRDVLWDRKTGLERAAGVPALPARVAGFERERWRAADASSLEADAQILLEAKPVDLPISAKPVRVMWGENDDGWPIKEQRELAARWDGRTTVLPDVGHQPHLEDPRKTAQALLAGRVHDGDFDR